MFSCLETKIKASSFDSFILAICYLGMPAILEVNISRRPSQKKKIFIVLIQVLFSGNDGFDSALRFTPLPGL